MKADFRLWIASLGAANRFDRVRAAHELCRLACEETVIEALIEALQSGSEETRKGVAFTLGMLMTPLRRAIAALTDALEDPSEEVRRRVVISLSEWAAPLALARSEAETRLSGSPPSLQALAREVLCSSDAPRNSQAA